MNYYEKYKLYKKLYKTIKFTNEMSGDSKNHLGGTGDEHVGENPPKPKPNTQPRIDMGSFQSNWMQPQYPPIVGLLPPTGMWEVTGRSRHDTFSYRTWCQFNKDATFKGLEQSHVPNHALQWISGNYMETHPEIGMLKFVMGSVSKTPGEKEVRQVGSIIRFELPPNRDTGERLFEWRWRGRWSKMDNSDEGTFINRFIPNQTL
jgi:hypothetical protein